MSNSHGNYTSARQQLISFLQSQGYQTHPNEVFCPSMGHCWVDVAALKESEYWAFEYKSRTDSIRRGVEQCCSYAKAFNYVVLVADRCRLSSSRYFFHLVHQGFGLWRHDGVKFYPIVNPKRHAIDTRHRAVIERQFRRLPKNLDSVRATQMSEWLHYSSVETSRPPA